MESNDTGPERAESTVITMHADEYNRDAHVASDGRLWLGEEWAGKDVEIALREKAE